MVKELFEIVNLEVCIYDSLSIYLFLAYLLYCCLLISYCCPCLLSSCVIC